MILMSLDLELNQPCNTIIQIGITVGDTETGLISEIVRYDIKSDTQVTPYITDLTGITQQQVDTGIPLQEAYTDICRLHGIHKCFMNPLVWGSGDMELLRSQLNMDNQRWVFGRRFIDAKTVFIARQMAGGLPFAGGLRNSMKRLGLKFEGLAHRADVDAINTFRIYHKLLGEFNGTKREITK